MDDHNRSLGVHGAGFPFDSLGSTWSLVPITQKVKGYFVAWVEKNLRQEASQGSEAYATAIAAGIAAGRYKWGKRGCREWLNRDEGLIYLTFLLLSLYKHPDVKTIDRTEEIIAGNPEEWLKALMEVIRDPNFHLSPGKETATGTGQTQTMEQMQGPMVPLAAG